MPHAAISLVDGVNENRTPALNQFGLSYSQLIRYQFDNQGQILAQKTGGWTKFYPSTFAAPIRALWAWEDVNDQSHLAYGTQTITVSARLGVITNGVDQDITPTTTTDNVAPMAATTINNSTVTITDATTTSLTSFDTVYIKTHIAVGGLILFGLYPITALGVNNYNITATDILGNPELALSTSSTANVASFSVANGSNVVTVTLANNDFTVGDTYPILVSTTLGGVTLFGNHVVASVQSTNVFTVVAATQATSNATASINSGHVQYVYSFAPTTSPPRGTELAASNWTMGNWGQTLIVCPINDGTFQPIYQWTPQGGSVIANVIPQAPPVNDGIFIAMPQRQIVAWGSTFTGVQDPLLLRWCDVNNYSVWIGQVTNQAGSYRLAKGSKIVGAIQAPQQGLIWTDIGLWSMQYIGGELVYAFNEIGTGCGLIARVAAASVQGVVYWMGPTQFFSLSETGVQAVQCPVWDVIFQDLDTNNLDKIRVAVNSRFNEIAWYYPTVSSGGEVSNYVKYNTAIGLWDYGALARSAWIDQSVLGAPIGADPNLNYIYQHETSNNADGAPLQASFQTGYWALNEGDNLIFLDQFWPDFKWGDYGGSQNATLQITIYGVNYPGDTPVQDGPHTVTQATQFFTPRIRNRLMSFAVASADLGSFWRIGRSRCRYTPDGKF